MPGGSFSPAVRIIVAEARPVLLDRVKVLSEQYSDLLLVGTATTGHSAMTTAGRTDPDVVLIQQQLPDADGLSVCEEISRRQPETAIILISDAQADRAMLAAVEAGARGLLSPLASDDDVVVAILRAAEGEFLLPGPVVQRLFRLGGELRRLHEARCTSRHD